MSREELIEKLKSLIGGDPEGGHADADRALLAYIDDPEITEVYHAIEKWYA